VVGEIVSIGSLVITFGASQWGIYKYFDTRISRIYERFDEHKKETEAKYVNKDLCKVMHDNNAENLNGLEKRIDARFDKVDQRLEDTFNNIDQKITKLLTK
jgi:hypothetical protein